MLFSRREINVWPGFSDLMFMLAVSTLVVAGGIVLAMNERDDRLDAQEAVLAKLDARLRDLGIDPDEAEPCGLGGPVINQLQKCLGEARVDVERRGCSLAVKSTILFEKNDDRLRPDANRAVERLAPCVVAAARSVAEQPVVAGVGLDSLVIEGHTDRCGYESWAEANNVGMGLAATRAKAVYDVVFRAVIQDPELSGGGLRERILARIVTRSLGPYRPLADSTCDCSRSTEGSCEADRRVEIVVQGRIGSGEETWRPPSSIPLRGIVTRNRIGSAGARGDAE